MRGIKKKKQCRKKTQEFWVCGCGWVLKNKNKNLEDVDGKNPNQKHPKTTQGRQYKKVPTFQIALGRKG